jgi:hypothetical protein
MPAKNYMMKAPTRVPAEVLTLRDRVAVLEGYLRVAESNSDHLAGALRDVRAALIGDYLDSAAAIGDGDDAEYTRVALASSALGVARAVGIYLATTGEYSNADTAVLALYTGTLPGYAEAIVDRWLEREGISVHAITDHAALADLVRDELGDGVPLDELDIAKLADGYGSNGFTPIRSEAPF